MSEFALKFWGVRGSIPTPGPENISYGGNTTCIELHCGSETLVIDAGSGMRNLGLNLPKRFPGQHLNVHLLFTHFHWDHLQGLPFFIPLYGEDNEFNFYSSCQPERLRAILEGQMAAPYFPVSFKFLSSKRNFLELKKPHQIGRAKVYPFPLNHPQGATGFRIEVGSSVVTHASDLEHGEAEFDKVLREYAQNADVLIYDSQYTPEEYPNRRGWGHSTWMEAIKVARDCNVKRVILFHHDPGHNDAAVGEIEKEARTHFAETYAAKEGWEFPL
ncbi:MAG TPA: MBL fold metallo-hydrolase [Bryobacteraceae bacterium]|jgi:phosphoribosyl 1,2-cyclic phosphodiesterase|nr:MBL fold metallo-hydrolase [Bryobacteraceae bacterium]